MIAGLKGGRRSHETKDAGTFCEQGKARKQILH
jgi:hypothetical protein